VTRLGKPSKKERVLQVSRPPSVRTVVRQRIAALSAAIIGAGLLISVAGSAGAAPTPTLAQAEHKVTELQAKLGRLGQQFDAVQQQLQNTNQRLSLLDKQLGRYTTRFNVMRGEIARIAVTAYEEGNINSSVNLLSSGDPQQILNQSSILQELSASNKAQIAAFLTAAKQLEDTQRVELRTKAGIVQLRNSLRSRRAAMTKLVSQEKALVTKLTPVQQAAAGVGGGTSTPVQYTGPTSTQAGKAVAYAYAQLGCPYVYGGTGPCSQGFDCSGLTMEAWAAAGVSIPRTSYEQWGSLPHVSPSNMQPGDILVMLGAGHVGIYVGHGEMIHAPQPGQNVQLVSTSGWVMQNLDGVVRP
jgi:cell wall-associated NlpC family hydrolase